MESESNVRARFFLPPPIGILVLLKAACLVLVWNKKQHKKEQLWQVLPITILIGCDQTTGSLSYL